MWLTLGIIFARGPLNLVYAAYYLACCCRCCYSTHTPLPGISSSEVLTALISRFCVVNLSLGVYHISGRWARRLFSLSASGYRRSLLSLTSLVFDFIMIEARHDHGGGATGNATAGSNVFHFQGGDVLWFLGWMPSSHGAIAGAAIGLFLLAIVERWLAAMRVVMESWWKQKCACPHSHAVER